jgi:hypothetical protein
MPSAGNRSPYAIEELTIIMHRSRFGAFWRWRSELLIAVVLMTGYFHLAWWVASYSWPLAILGGLALVLVLLPWSRRFLAARFWALYTRHRLQRAFWELRLHTRAGRLPLIAWITATPVGSRALVISRAGLCFEDFENCAAEFASACSAREARVTSFSARWPWLICIDIIRRDVLGPARVIRSPLAELPVTDTAALDPALAED